MRLQDDQISQDPLDNSTATMQKEPRLASRHKDWMLGSIHEIHGANRDEKTGKCSVRNLKGVGILGLSPQ